MEALRAAPGAVTEAAIFVALSPQTYAAYRRPQATRSRSSSSGIPGDGVSLPRVGPPRIESPRPKVGASEVPVAEVMLPPKTPRSLMTNTPITADECVIVWRFLCDWITAQLAMEAPAPIPGFGTFTLRADHSQQRVAIFKPERAFLDKFALQTTQASRNFAQSRQSAAAGIVPVSGGKQSSQTPVLRKRPVESGQPAQQHEALSFMEMAACCASTIPIDAAKAQEWLQAVIQKIGESMCECKRVFHTWRNWLPSEYKVELNLRVGILTCTCATIEPQLVSTHSIVSAKLSQIEQAQQVGVFSSHASLQVDDRPAQHRSIAAAVTYQGRDLGARSSFLTSRAFSPAIQLHPVVAGVDVRVSEYPPHRPPPLSAHSSNTGSPRSQQLVSRRVQSPREIVYQRAGMPSVANPDGASNVVLVARHKDQDMANLSLFDPLSRTLCVEPDQNVSCLVPSNRIGANFSEAAKGLEAANISGDNRADSSKLGLMFLAVDALRSGPASTSSNSFPRSVESSEARYFECLRSKTFIELRYIAPLSPETERRVVAAAVKYLPSSLSSPRLVAVLNKEQRQMSDNYNASVKKAIFDYLLLRSETCNRVGVKYGVPIHAKLPMRWKWGDSTGVNGCMLDLKLLTTSPRGSERARSSKQPSTRCSEIETVLIRRIEFEANQAARKLSRQNLESKLAAKLLLTDPRVQRLQNLWFDLERSILLVKLPVTEELEPTTLTQDIHAFVREQLDHATQMKALLMSRWHDRARVIFATSIADCNVHGSGTSRLMNTVATLMAIQLRSLVEKSIARYLEFFERFSTERTSILTPTQIHRPSLILSLIVQTPSVQADEGMTIDFRSPLNEIPSHVLSVLHNLTRIFQDVPRVNAIECMPRETTEASTLWNVGTHEETVVAATIRIRAIVEQNLGHLRDLHALYQSYITEFQQAAGTFVFDDHARRQQADFNSAGSVEILRNTIHLAQAAVRSIQSQLVDDHHLDLFVVDCREANKALMSHCTQWIFASFAAFEVMTLGKATELSRAYKEVAVHLAKRPANLDELLETESFMERLKTRGLSELQDEAKMIKDHVRFLLFNREIASVNDIDTFGDHTVEVSKDDSNLQSGTASHRLYVHNLFASAAKAFQWHSKLLKLVRETDATLLGERARVESIFASRRTLLLAEIDHFEGGVRALATKGDLRHAATYVIQLGKMKETLQSFRQNADAIAIDEARLAWAATDFGKLDDIADAMEPYEQLWRTAREFREMSSRWLRGNIFELSGTEALTSLMQMLDIATNVSKRLRLSEAGAAITAELLRKQMTEFRENIRLVLALSNAAMKDRHMSEVATLLGVAEIETREAVTLLKLLENGAYERVPKIIEISESAARELAVELALAEIAMEWTTMRIEFKANNNNNNSNLKEEASNTIGGATDTVEVSQNPERPTMCPRMFILDKRVVEDIVSLTDDHAVRLQTLTCSTNSAPFADQIALWLEYCKQIRTAVDIMVSNERTWRYLSQIFNAGLANEVDAEESPAQSNAELFKKAEELYESILRQLIKNPTISSLIPRLEAMELVTNAKQTDLTAPTKDIESQLIICRDLLSSLEEKIRVEVDSTRGSFSRLNFLTDHDLMAVLTCSPSSSWLRSSPLWRIITQGCFPGIHRVALNSAGDITALISCVGEQFPLGAPIATYGATIASCLAKIENAMITILQASIRAALADLPRKEFRKWCLMWPEQVLQAAIMISWTLQGDSINHSGATNSSDEWNLLAAELTDKQIAVSKELKVAALQHTRVCLSNVISLLTHLRDVSQRISDELANSTHGPTGNETSMAWLAQPRLFYEGNVLSLRVMTTAPLHYGFEYLGNLTSPILVSPLTLRCYHAIAQTAGVLSGRGAVLEGPSGVGKTTIGAGLARLCGRLFVKYNALSEVSVVATTAERFVRGSAASGAWLMFVHLERHSAAQISSLATMCSRVREALAAGSSRCVLAGHKLRLRKGTFFLASLPAIEGLAIEFPQEAQFFFRRLNVPGFDVGYVAEALFALADFQNSRSLGQVVNATLAAFDCSASMPYPSSGQSQRDTTLTKANLVTFSAVKRVVARASEIRAACVNAFATPPLDSCAEAEYVRQGLRELLRSVSPTAYVDRLLDELIDSHSPISASSDGTPLVRDESTKLSPTKVAINSDERPLMPTLFVGQRMEVEVKQWIISNCAAQTAIFGAEFVSKALQLLQFLRSQRAVMITGALGSGKTSVFRSVAACLSSLGSNENPSSDPALDASIRNVDRPAQHSITNTRISVVCPRALPLSTLLGLESDNFGSTMLGTIVRDAKRASKTENGARTWLVIDGNVSSNWGDQLISLAHEEAYDTIGTLGLPKGMATPGGKFVSLPSCMDLIFESVSLADASPSFVTRVAIVSMGSPPVLHDWHALYDVWKSQHTREFGSVADEIFSIVDDALEETLEASLQFVAKEFELTTTTSSLARFQCLLAHLHGFLRLAIPKLISMISTKQRRMACCCFYIQALVWGVGNTTHSEERQRFHEFLRHLIINGPTSPTSMLKRTLTLFFPSGNDNAADQAGTVARLTSHRGSASSLIAGASALSSAMASTCIDTLYCYAFSVEFGLKWVRWSEYLDSWKQQMGSPTNTTEHRRLSCASLLERHATKVMVPTPAHTAAVCLMHQLLLAQYSVVLIGARDCGKTLALTNTRQMAITSSRASLVSERGDNNRGDFGDSVQYGSTVDMCHEVYVSAATSARDVLYQLDPLLRIIQATARAHNRRHFQPQTINSAKKECGEPTYIFIDDMHCIDDAPASSVDNAAEAIRMMTEHSVIVESRSNRLTECKNFVLIGSVQVPRLPANVSQCATARLTQKCVPVALPRFDDAALMSICSDLTSPSVMCSLGDSTTGVNRTEGTTSALQSDAKQLQSIILKASLKLFRVLTGGANAIFSPVVGVTPKKLLYNFRSDDLMLLVFSVCLGLSPTSTISDKPMFARRWCHESMRIIGDRLLEEPERSSFYQQLHMTALSAFAVTADMFLPSYMDAKNPAKIHEWMASKLHFTFVGENGGVGYIEGYREVSDLQKVELSIERSMMEMYRHNESREKHKNNRAMTLEIVLCDFVVRHVLRLCRVMRITCQATLLFGNPGSKMATMVRLAAFICKMPVFLADSPRVKSSTAHDRTEECAWRREWKRAIAATIHGLDTHVVLVVKEGPSRMNCQQLEALNQFLGGFGLPSDVIGYEDLSNDDLSRLWEHSTAVHRAAGSTNVSESPSQMTPSEVKTKHNVMLCLSALLRKKLRIVVATQSFDAVATLAWQFPHLVKRSAVCCIDDWPLESLLSVAQKCFLSSSTVDKERAKQLAAATVGIYDSTIRFTAATTCDFNRSLSVEKLKSTDLSEGPPNMPTLSWYDRPSRYTWIDPDMLVDHIGLILSFWDGIETAIKARRDKYAAGLKFLDETEQILRLEQSHAEALQPEMQKKMEIRRRMSGNLEREKFNANKITRGLEVATDLVEVQRERLAVIEREYMELIQDSTRGFRRAQRSMKKFCDAMQEGVEDFVTAEAVADQSVIQAMPTPTGSEDSPEVMDRTASAHDSPSSPNEITAALPITSPMLSEPRKVKKLINSFIAIKRAPTSLQQLAECIGLITGIEPVEEQSEEDPEELVQNYWKSLTKHMQSLVFWEDLTTYNANERISEKMVALLLPICMAPDFEKDMFSEVHELAGSLCEWVQACANLARDLVLASPKMAQLENERQSFADAQAQVTVRSQDLRNQVGTTLTQANAQRLESEIQRKKLEQKLLDNSSTLELTSSVWRVLQNSRSKWRRQHDYYTEFSAHWIGDLLLATATIAYASSLTAKVRETLRGGQWWSKVLGQHYLLHSAERPMHETLMVGDVMDRLRIDTFFRGFDKITCENVVIALQSYRVPVLMDPHGIAVDWLRKYGENLQGGLCSISAQSAPSSEIWTAICNSVHTNSLIVVTDFNMHLAKDLSSFIAAKRHALYNSMNRDIVGTGSTGGFDDDSCPSGEWLGQKRHQFWCCQPATPPSSSYQLACGLQLSDEDELGPSLFEFSSDACKVVFVYPNSETTPAWMATYQSQLSLVQFELTHLFVESKAVHTVLQASCNSSILTEIDTLDLDMRAAKEQMDAIESELLAFLSSNTASSVCVDASSVLKIVATHNAFQSLEQGRVEASAKLQANLVRLESYSVLVDRCHDVVTGWREAASYHMTTHSNKLSGNSFSLAPFWPLLAKAVQTNEEGTTLSNAAVAFISKARTFVTTRLRDEEQLVFDFMLAFHLYQRRVARDILHENRVDTGAKQMPDASRLRAAGGAIRSSQENHELLLHVLSLVACEDTIAMAKATSIKLLKLRPEGLTKEQWFALCFIAEGSPGLQNFIEHQLSLNGEKPSLERVVAAARAASAVVPSGTRDESVAVRLADTPNLLFRLCIQIALDKNDFLSELEIFVSNVLNQEYDSDKRNVSMPADEQCAEPAELRVNFCHPIRRELAVKCRYSEESGSAGLFDIWQSFTGPQTPIIVIAADPDVNVVRLVEEAATKARATVNMNAFSTLHESDFGAFERQLLLATSKGHWVVFQHVHTLKPCHHAHLVGRLLHILEGQQHHSDFRVWLSLIPSYIDSKRDDVSVHEDALSRLLQMAGVYTTCGLGSVSMKRALCGALKLLKSELANVDELSNSSKHTLVRISVFHALVSSRAELALAQWKLRFEFGDADMTEAIQALLALLPHKPKRLANADDEHKSTTETEGRAVWSKDTVQAVLENVYCTKVREAQDAAILRNCFEVVFSDSTRVNEGMVPPTLSQVLAIVQALAEADLDRVHEVISKLPKFPSRIAHSTLSEREHEQTPRGCLQISTEHREFQRRLATTIAKVFVDFPHPDMAPASAQRARRLEPLMNKVRSIRPSLTKEHLNALAEFRIELHKVKVDPAIERTETMAANTSYTLQAFIQCELSALRHASCHIDREICQILSISSRDTPFEAVSLGIVTELVENHVPKGWLELVDPSAATATYGRHSALEAFRIKFVQRLADLTLWRNTELPIKMPLTHFTNTKMFLEAVHRHLKRSALVSCWCTGHDCLIVTSILRDTTSLLLAAMPQSVYVSGVKLVGRLKYDSPSPGMKHTEAAANTTSEQVASECSSQDGTSVVLEVTSACVLRNFERGDQTDRLLTSRCAFRCPIYRGGQLAEATITVCTAIPLTNLALSGSGLRVAWNE